MAFHTNSIYLPYKVILDNYLKKCNDSMDMNVIICTELNNICRCGKRENSFYKIFYFLFLWTLI
jgi:hypothetical protein